MGGAKGEIQMVWHGMALRFLPLFLMWLFCAATVVVPVVLILRFLGRSSQSSTGRTGSGAEEILKQRYARGELTKEQYEEMLREIRR